MILITGGAGYIGSHTALNFLKSGLDVVIFDSLEKGHIETVETLKKEGNLHFVKGDLKNYEDIINVFKKKMFREKELLKILSSSYNTLCIRRRR